MAFVVVVGCRVMLACVQRGLHPLGERDECEDRLCNPLCLHVTLHDFYVEGWHSACCTIVLHQQGLLRLQVQCLYVRVFEQLAVVPVAFACNSWPVVACYVATWVSCSTCETVASLTDAAAC